MVSALAQFQKEFNKDPARLLALGGVVLRNATTTPSMDRS